MNYITAVVRKRESFDKLNILSFEANNQHLTMTSLALSDAIQEGTKVILAYKSTNVVLAKNLAGELSISNQLKVKIESLNRGKLLCSVKFIFIQELQESIITKASAERMKLQVGDEVIALIKASDLSIEEVL